MKRTVFEMIGLALSAALLLALLCACGNRAPAESAGTSAAVAQSAAVRGEKTNPERSAPTGETQAGQADSKPAKKTQPEKTGPVVAIDPGHQEHADSSREPVGPGASETKAKVATGTSGAESGLKEYELTLLIARKLQAELTGRGYRVVMIRTANDVNISNSERAELANRAGAGAFIRIHANGSDNPSVSGAMTICQTPENPYNGALAKQSRRLAAEVLDGLVAATGCKKERVWETDSMSGINWAQVPVTIVEVGYMTNPEEDRRMATEAYQKKIAAGIADGIDAFFKA